MFVSHVSSVSPSLTTIDKDKQHEGSLKLLNIPGLYFSFVYGVFNDAGLKTSFGERVVNDAFERKQLWPDLSCCPDVW
jgi:hypothetical protein